MDKTKVALLTFAEHRDDFYFKRRSLVEKHSRQVRELLSRHVDIFAFDEPIRSLEKVREACAAVRKTVCDCVVFNIPIWVAPNLTAVAAKLLQLPIVLLANTELETSSLPGMLGCGAALDQVGIAHRRLWGNLDDQEFLKKLWAFFAAARAVNRLRGMRYGMFGGRSLGIYSAVFDASQWLSLFGIDAEHMDQVEIIRRAEKQPTQEVKSLARWLFEQGLVTEFNDTLFTEEHLQKQIRSYLATREIVAENKFAFISIKCQPELSNGYCLQCLNCALLNDPYDHNGLKSPLPCACEADSDGALTMILLNKISGGKPTALMDIRGILPEEGILLLNNCGSLPSFFAGRSINAADNLQKIKMVPHVFGEAGGGSIQFTCAPGPLTLVRFCRKGGHYRLVVTGGEVISGREDLLRSSTTCWPHAVVKTEINLKKFISEYSSNHIHAVPGDYRQELVIAGRLLGIETHLYNGGESHIEVE